MSDRVIVVDVVDDRRRVWLRLSVTRVNVAELNVLVQVHLLRSCRLEGLLSRSRRRYRVGSLQRRL